MWNGKYAFKKSKIIQGDTIQMMMGLNDKSVDLILADLPYGTTNNKWDVIVDMQLLWEQYLRIIKDDGNIVLTACNPFAAQLILSQPKLYRYDLVWNKKRPTGQLNSKKQPLRQHELILVFYKKLGTYNPQMHENRLKRNFNGEVNKSKKQSDNWGKQYDYNSNINTTDKSFPRSIIEQTAVIGNSKEKLPHSTQKPVELFKWIVKTFSNKGDLILDNTAGSGTTGEACIETNRDFILIDNDPESIIMMKERVRKIFKNYGMFAQNLINSELLSACA